jgi:hypothetical protein
VLKAAPQVVLKPLPVVVICIAVSVPTIVAALPQPEVNELGAVWCVLIWPPISILLEAIATKLDPG